MTKLEQYRAKAAESLAAAEAATNARDRAFHHRAHSVWRRLIAGIAEAEEREALNPARATPSKPRPVAE
jgi:hypothetical protein